MASIREKFDKKIKTMYAVLIISSLIGGACLLSVFSNLDPALKSACGLVALATLSFLFAFSVRMMSSRPYHFLKYIDCPHCKKSITADKWNVKCASCDNDLWDQFWIFGKCPKCEKKLDGLLCYYCNQPIDFDEDIDG